MKRKISNAITTSILFLGLNACELVSLNNNSAANAQGAAQSNENSEDELSRVKQEEEELFAEPKYAPPIYIDELLGPEDIEYRREFSLKTKFDSHWSDPKQKKLGFSRGVFTIENEGETLVIAGFPHTNLVGRFSIPGPDNDVGVQLEPWFDVSHGHKSEIEAASINLEGLQFLNGKLAYIFKDYYNADFSNDPSFGRGEEGLYRMQTSSAKGAGHLGLIDPAYVDKFGGARMYTGLAGTTNRGSSSMGPAIVLIEEDLANLPEDKSISLRSSTLQHYPLNDPHPDWNAASELRGAFQVGRSFVSFGYAGNGSVRYGEPNGEPCVTAKGYIPSNGYVPVMWVSDAEQVLEVYQNLRRPEEVETTMYPINDLLQSNRTCEKAFSADFNRATGEIFVSVKDWENKGESQPKIVILGLKGWATSAKP